MSFIGRIFRRDKGLGEFGTSSGVMMLPGSSGYTARRSVAETLAAFGTSPWFRAVVERVAFASATVPWHVHVVRSSGGQKGFVKHAALQGVSSFFAREKILRQLKSTGRLVEIENHPLTHILSNPCPAITGIDFRFISFATLLVAGEVGWALERSSGGGLESLWLVPPHWIVRRPSDAESRGRWDVQIGGRRYSYSQDEFVLFKNPSLHNPYGPGSGIGISLSDELESDEYISKFQKTWFHSRGRPDLIVSVSRGNSDELKVQKERFENEYRDSRRGGRSLWVRGEDLKINTIEQKFVDMDLTSQRTWLKDLARQVLGVPPELMGDIKNSNRATITDARYILAELSVMPQCERMRAHLQRSIVPLYDPRLVVGYQDPRPDDRQYRLDAVAKIPWSATQGEIRRLQGLEDRGDFDNVHMVPSALVPVVGPSRRKEHQVATIKELVLEERRSIKGDTLSDIPGLVDSVDPLYLERELTPHIEKSIRKWGTRTFQDIGVSAAFDMVNPKVIEHVARFSSGRITMINDTTRERVRELLRVSVSEGYGADKVARLLREQFDWADKTRSLSIATTEINRSANFGVYIGQKESGAVSSRQWIGTPDDKIRDAHSVLDGNVVGMEEPFEVDGFTSMFPGDFGIAYLDIGCRCTTAAVIEGAKDTSAAVYKHFFNETEKDIRDMREAVRRAFRAQLVALLDTVEGKYA